MMVFPKNHKRFLYKIPAKLADFIFDSFLFDVCCNCCFSLIDDGGKMENKPNFIGKTWSYQITQNIFQYKEPSINWINISL